MATSMVVMPFCHSPLLTVPKWPAPMLVEMLQENRGEEGEEEGGGLIEREGRIG